jgi:predicted  nucleic acid-binding Zn-ribbon protein
MQVIASKDAEVQDLMKRLAATEKQLAELEKQVVATQSQTYAARKALEKEVAAVQRELEDARKAAEGTHALLGGESALLSEALEKACAQGITLTQERDALASEVESLERQRKELEEQLATAREQKVVTAREVQGLKPGVACLEENLQQKTLAELDVVAMTSTVANSAAAAAAENARVERQVEKLTKVALNPKPTP